MTSFAVPGKFVFLHMPKTGGMWFTDHVQRQVPIVDLGMHATRQQIPAAFRDLPVVSMVRESADWLESYFNFAMAKGWDHGNTLERTSQAETCDQFALNLMHNHPRILETHLDAYCDPAGFQIDFEHLERESQLVLRHFGLTGERHARINSIPHISQFSPEVRDTWQVHNANLAERYGWRLPSGFTFALDDWTGWWRETCQFLAPRFRGRPVSLLEIGVCEGRGAKVAFETLLRHTDSRYTGVDIWAMSPCARACKNVALAAEGRLARVLTSATDHSSCFVNDCWPDQIYHDRFGVIYVDGDHSEPGCYEDLTTAARLILAGGVIVVDDCGSAASPSEYPGVQVAVERFFAGDQRFQELAVPQGDSYQRLFLRR